MLRYDTHVKRDLCKSKETYKKRPIRVKKDLRKNLSHSKETYKKDLLTIDTHLSVLKNVEDLKRDLRKETYVQYVCVPMNIHIYIYSCIYTFEQYVHVYTYLRGDICNCQGLTPRIRRRPRNSVQMCIYTHVYICIHIYLNIYIHT